MRKASFEITLSPSDRAQLGQWESAQGTPQQVALRCRIILMALAGEQNQTIAARLGVSRPTVNLWRGRVRDSGIGEVWEIAPGRGRKPYYDQAKRDAIINSTLPTKPKGMTHWSCRLMAGEQEVSKDTVNRLCQLHNIKPHLSRPFNLKNAPLRWNSLRFRGKAPIVSSVYLRNRRFCVAQIGEPQAFNFVRPLQKRFS